MTQTSRATIAVLFSGGLDSSVMLASLVAEGHRVQPLYVDSQLRWQAAERHWAERFLAAIATPRLAELVVLSLPLADLYESHWSISGRGVPQAEGPDEEVYLPGRNPLLLVKADIWCRLHGVERLALGALSSNPFADASDTFFRAFAGAMDEALGGRVELVRPLAALGKRQVMKLAAGVPLELTFSCLDPGGELHCGRCNKCAERQQAFAEALVDDPTRYGAAERHTATERAH